jgi:hypothetical protein
MYCVHLCVHYSPIYFVSSCYRQKRDVRSLRFHVCTPIDVPNSTQVADIRVFVMPRHVVTSSSFEVDGCTCKDCLCGA